MRRGTCWICCALLCYTAQDFLNNLHLIAMAMVSIEGQDLYISVKIKTTESKMGQEQQKRKTPKLLGRSEG